MVPYEVDSIILNLMRKWINEALSNGKECLQRAKETEVSLGSIVLFPSKIKRKDTIKNICLQH